MTGNPEEALSWNRLLATLLLMLALGACAQVAGQGQAPYAPYTHDDSDYATAAMVVAAGACNGQNVPEQGPPYPQSTQRSRGLWRSAHR